MLHLLRLGQMPYADALAIQLELRHRLQQRDPDDALEGYLLSVQHPPTVTLGKRGLPEHLTSPEQLRAHGVEVFQIDRGGEATFHEPGQLVVYPILPIRDLSIGVVDLIQNLAKSMAEAVAPFGVEAAYDSDHPGLWTVEETPCKLASVGMRVAGGVTTHGIAINLTNAMTGFTWIVPCGMPQAPMCRLIDYIDDARRDAPYAVIEAVEERFFERFVAYLAREVAEPEEIPVASARFMDEAGAKRMPE